MNDFDQLKQWQQHIKPTAELVRVEGALLAEKIRHEQTFQTAVKALHEIAEMEVDPHCSLGDIIRRMREKAQAAFLEIAGAEMPNVPTDCEDKDMPPFLVKARRDRMRQIWLEVNGGKS